MQVPPRACDCHVHIFGPAARFPFVAHRAYTPPDASIGKLLELQKRLGFERVVIVHPSPYGTDNSCTLDALSHLGARARGVAVIDKGISKTELLEMHNLGIRGIRVNLETSGVHEPAAAQRLLQEATEQVAPLGWHVQTFTNLSLLRKAQIEDLRVPLVIDHFGLPRTQDDVDYLASLLRSGKAYVKLSAPHRVPIDPGPVARELIAANPERCLWGTDWPHPFTRGPRKSAEVQPFDPIDDVAALHRFRGWVGDAALFRKILVDNPARLYDF